MNAEEVLVHINSQRGTSYRIVGCYAQGESGAASRVEDASGNRYVLKCGATAGGEVGDAHFPGITTRLRSLGYPAPEYVAVGIAAETWYLLHTAMPGEPIADRVSLALLPQILRLNDLQRGQGVSTDDDPDRIVRGVMEGHTGYCIIETLQSYSTESAAILDRLQRIVEAHASECPRRSDIVHWDFHNNNVLMENDCVSGVIDWEGSYSGDCAFDLATMLFYTWRFRDFREALGSALLQRTTKGAVAVYLAHMIVRQLDWSMRHHPKDAVDYYMRTARAILQALDQGLIWGAK